MSPPRLARPDAPPEMELNAARPARPIARVERATLGAGSRNLWLVLGLGTENGEKEVFLG
ncbi:MAG: hypothetical protein K8T25_00850 [Planctomycetia bacterium]|nr:hypothetical protein [Planctomycetia bacterium]